MSFLSTGVYTTFSPNTKAKSAEVNANNAANVAFFNTITSDIMANSGWAKIATTAASYTISSTNPIRTLIIDVNTSAGYTVTLPTAAASANRIITIKHNGGTTGALTIDGAGSETIDGTLTKSLALRYEFMELHCDGTDWHITDRYIKSVWTPYTLSITASTTAPTEGSGATKSAVWRRVGDSMEIHFEYKQSASGTAGSGTYLFPIPTGYTIDSSKFAPSTFGISEMTVGTVATRTTGNFYYGVVVAHNTTSLALSIGDSNSNLGTIGNTNSGLNNATQYYSFFAKVPITQFEL